MKLDNVPTDNGTDTREVGNGRVPSCEEFDRPGNRKVN